MARSEDSTEGLSRPIARTRSTSSALKLSPLIFTPSTPLFSPVSEGSTSIQIAPQMSSPPPCCPTVRYFYSKKSSNHISYMYRVLDKGSAGRKCLPEAQSWPELHLTADELQKNFHKLEDRMIFSNSTQSVTSGGPRVLYPSLADLKKWQVGCAVCFRHCDVRGTGLVVGRFVWEGRVCATRTPDKTLTLVLLLQTPTNKLLLSSEVTDLEVEDMQAMTTRGEVYIQGVSLLAIVATLIANVTYLAMVNPPDGTEVLGVLPVTFTFFNAIAFFSSVLAVVVMTAFIPIFGTARQWGAIFLSGSMPVVVGLISFYISFIVCAWSVMTTWVKPLGITLLGCTMVVYVHIWAVQLMNGHIEKDLRIQPRMTPWEWYFKRTGRHPDWLARSSTRLKFIYLSVLEKGLSSLFWALVNSTSHEQKAFLLAD